MPRILKRALLASLVLHIAIGLWFWLKKTPPRDTETKLEIEIKETSAPAPQGDPHSQKKSSHKSGAKRSIRIGEDLQWKNLRIGAAPEHTGQGNFTDEGNLGLEEGEWGSHGALLAEAENLPKLQRLFTEIQGLLYYPARLGNHGITDAVNTRLYFDENSQCDWQRTKIGGSHPYFRVYTLALFKKLCGMTKNMADMRFKKGQFADIGFNFQLVGSMQYAEDAVRDRIVGNVLMFERTFFRPKTKIELGPFETDPVFGQIIAINIPWIQEHWEKWVEGRDPMREFRDP